MDVATNLQQLKRRVGEIESWCVSSYAMVWGGMAWPRWSNRTELLEKVRHTARKEQCEHEQSWWPYQAHEGGRKLGLSQGALWPWTLGLDDPHNHAEKLCPLEYIYMEGEEGFEVEFGTGSLVQWVQDGEHILDSMKIKTSPCS